MALHYDAETDTYTDDTPARELPESNEPSWADAVLGAVLFIVVLGCLLAAAGRIQ